MASADGTTAYFFGGLTAAGASNDVFSLAPNGYADPQPSEMTNIALFKNTSQHTTDPTWGATGPSRAVDGIQSTNHMSLANAPAGSTNNMCTHTLTMSNP